MALSVVHVVVRAADLSVHVGKDAMRAWSDFFVCQLMLLDSEKMGVYFVVFLDRPVKNTTAKPVNAAVAIAAPAVGWPLTAT